MPTVETTNVVKTLVKSLTPIFEEQLDGLEKAVKIEEESLVNGKTSTPRTEHNVWYLRKITNIRNALEELQDEVYELKPNRRQKKVGTRLHSSFFERETMVTILPMEK